MAQRVGSLALTIGPRFQAWLTSQNARRDNVYVSVKAITPGQWTRTRAAVRAVRHVFLEPDDDALRVVAEIETRPDFPPLSCILHASPNRAHLFWQVTGFTPYVAEALQKQLARELGTDSAATPSTQSTRLPGL